MESAWTVTRKERARKGIDHSLARTTGRKIMIRVLHVQEVLIPKIQNKKTRLIRDTIRKKRKLHKRSLVARRGWQETSYYNEDKHTPLDNKKIALRTIPVILKNGRQKVSVNCLLDEGSNTTYINEDVVDELGVTGAKERIEVKWSRSALCMSNTFTIGLVSTDGRIDTEIVAKTSEKICGGMTPKQNWNHLKDITIAFTSHHR